MFGLFKKKTEVEKLQEKYQKLMKEAFEISKINRSESDAKYVSEMAIVDTFARLIFQDQGDFSLREKMIIETFKMVDANVLQDSYSECPKICSVSFVLY